MNGGDVLTVFPARVRVTVTVCVPVPFVVVDTCSEDSKRDCTLGRLGRRDGLRLASVVRCRHPVGRGLHPLLGQPPIVVVI